jgi:ribosomal protein L37AE/L43A
MKSTDNGQMNWVLLVTFWCKRRNNAETRRTLRPAGVREGTWSDKNYGQAQKERHSPRKTAQLSWQTRNKKVSTRHVTESPACHSETLRRFSSWRCWHCVSLSSQPSRHSIFMIADRGIVRYAFGNHKRRVLAFFLLVIAFNCVSLLERKRAIERWPCKERKLRPKIKVLGWGLCESVDRGKVVALGSVGAYSMCTNVL